MKNTFYWIPLLLLLSISCDKEETTNDQSNRKATHEENMLGTWEGTIREEISQNSYQTTVTISNIKKGEKAGEGIAKYNPSISIPFEWTYNGYKEAEEELLFFQEITEGLDKGNTSAVIVTFENDDRIVVRWTGLLWSGIFEKK